MTTLTQLIEHHCPKGVEYVKLGDVAEIARKTCQPARMGTGSVVLYSLPAFDEGAPERLDPTEIKSGKIILSEPSLLVPKLNPRKPRVWLVKAPSPRSYCSTEFFPIQADNSSLSLRYLYYVICDTISELAFLVDGGSNSHKRLNRDIYLDLLIPLPAREVQDAIVERLDVFATLIESLDSEIALREKRFEYFREQLLNFDESDGVEYMKLEDVAEYSSLRVDSVDLNADTFVGVDNLLKDRGGKTLSEHGPNTKRSTKYQVGDVLLGNIRPYLRKIWHATNEGGCSGDVLAIHPSTVYSRFLYWTLFGDEFWHYNNNFSRGGKMPRGDKSAILAYQFPLPSLAVQQDIADKLDTMQALIDNLKYERDLRKAQFEYYREKLLTFNS